jgi:hypothetical protein
MTFSCVSFRVLMDMCCVLLSSFTSSQTTSKVSLVMAPAALLLLEAGFAVVAPKPEEE